MTYITCTYTISLSPEQLQALPLTSTIPSIPLQMRMASTGSRQEGQVDDQCIHVTSHITCDDTLNCEAQDLIECAAGVQSALLHIQPITSGTYTCSRFRSVFWWSAFMTDGPHAIITSCLRPVNFLIFLWIPVCTKDLGDNLDHTYMKEMVVSLHCADY